MSVCLGCLKQIENKVYCNACQRNVFNGKSPTLYLKKSEFQSIRYQKIDHFSISGVQDKISLKLSGKDLISTTGEGEYILKPVPSINVEQLQFDVPANEHLTMQIAKQIFKIQTAENALINFQDGESAYITKRFDRYDGHKIHQEDFCQIGGISPETNGPNFKYESSYHEMGEIIKKHCVAPKIEIEKLYKLVLFNYMFGNGDAHQKNFSLIETINGDFVLSPAYDLLNTNIHFPEESRMALDLLKHFETEHYKINAFYGFEDFMKLGEFYGIKSNRNKKMILEFPAQREKVEKLISRSFLSQEGRKKYLEIFLDRLKAMIE
ncbi:MAG: HipA domain-containing protein [Candidatus Cloacimonetes bacterium]|jgi:serine/threonine-protein kinase HipA|nr:HipA domain-containing protein [Candidatus Cloacimonadota bacterium]